MTQKNKSSARREAPATPSGTRGGLRQLADEALQSEPIAPPIIDPDLERLAPIERAGEVLRYTLCRAEYWLSPGGLLREWLRFNLRLALWLGIPALVLTPVITVLLTTAVTWSGILVEIAKKLVLLPAWLGAALLAMTALGVLWRFLFGR